MTAQVARKRHGIRHEHRFAHTVILIILLVILVVSIFPYVYLLSTALRPRAEIFRFPPSWLPDTWAPRELRRRLACGCPWEVDPQQCDRLGRLDGADPGARDPGRLRPRPPEVPGPAGVPSTPSRHADVLAGDPDHRSVPIHVVHWPHRQSAVARSSRTPPSRSPSRPGSSRATTARCHWRSRRPRWLTVARGLARSCG